MDDTTKTSTERIAQLNDALRERVGLPRDCVNRINEVVETLRISTLSQGVKAEIHKRVREFDDFESGNNPYGERDFGSIDVQGAGRVFWKIDYYDRKLEYGSEDPADPDKTVRVLTIMLAEEW